MSSSTKTPWSATICCRSTTRSSWNRREGCGVTGGSRGGGRARVHGQLATPKMFETIIPQRWPVLTLCLWRWRNFFFYNLALPNELAPPKDFMLDPPLCGPRGGRGRIRIDHGRWPTIVLQNILTFLPIPTFAVLLLVDPDLTRAAKKLIAHASRATRILCEYVGT